VLHRSLPLVLLTAFRVVGADFVPPPGDGLVDVKADCGAKGDGTSDDTAALREAFEAGKARPGKHGAARAIWLPVGTYLVREPIRVGDKKKFIAGQDRARTVIRLADRSPAFADPARPTPLISFGKGSRPDWHFAQNFDQRLVNLTIEVGAANPAAVGILYHTNNSGGMHGVTIRSLDPDRRGACGLLLSDRPGPGLVWDGAIEGFDVGCRIDGDLHGMTIGKLSLCGQRACGFRADGNFSMVPAFTNRESNVSISIGHYGVKYDSLVEEIRAGEKRELTPAILDGQWVPLYSGWTRRPGVSRERKE
jgi:hypothetical protein